MYVNNEIGTIQPIKEAAEIAHKNNMLFHTDAVQAMGCLHIDVKDMKKSSKNKTNGGYSQKITLKSKKKKYIIKFVV